MTELNNYSKGRAKIGIFGVGRSNLGVLNHLTEQGLDFELTVRSDKPTPPGINAERCFTGADAMRSIDEDILFLSPSVRRDRPELIAAAERGTLLSSDAELFFSESETDVFAVTGSDGKSTTASLISEILVASGKKALPAGNYGRSLCTLIGSDATVVAELSSFQLSYLTPRVRSAVITNITPNHLNWHTSLAEYVSAKLNITKNAERITVDHDSELLRASLGGMDIYSAVSLELDHSTLRSRIKAQNYLTTRGNTVYLNGSPYFSFENARRKERYNIRNFMLAAAATLDVAEPDAVTDTVERFKGLSHRAETVATAHGIAYIDSSIDSSPERTLKTLGALEGNVAVIICGAGKGLPLDALADRLPQLTVGAVLMGPVGHGVYGLLASRRSGYKFSTAGTMREAISLAESYLPEGGTVILSPAGTSFDRYADFEERGADFKNAVLSHLYDK